jgi:alpha-L-arabinofuranosidase
VGTIFLTITETEAPYYTTTKLSQNRATAMVPTNITISSDRKNLYIMMVNGSWQNSYPVEITINNLKPSASEAVYLSSDDQNGNPLVKKNDFVKSLSIKSTATNNDATITYTIPAHSIVFAKITK